MSIGAIGVVEVSFYSNGVVVLDTMLKTAGVELVSCHKKLGGKMVHIIIEGEVSSVNAAIEAAKDAGSIVGKKNIKVAIAISNPHPEVIKLMNLLNTN